MRKLLYFLCLLIAPTFSMSQGFTINANADLVDANGNVFIPKGINVPLAWFQNDVLSNIANIRTNTGVNSLRIVLGNGYTPQGGTGQNWSTPDNVWQQAVELCIANDIIPMVEVHNVLGSNIQADLEAVATWWASKAAFLTRADIEPYILINICNEWGDWWLASPNQEPPQTRWRDAYISAVNIIRNAGIKTTLIIDAPNYGQDVQGSTLLNYAPAVLAADPEQNIQFSVHMYCEWSNNGNSNITTLLPQIKNAGIPINVGEFAYQHATDGSCDIDVDAILSSCEANGIGWYAWSWKGNGGGLEYMDVSVNWSGTNLNGTWGQRVVNGTNGTKTGITASVFTQGPNSPPTVSLTAPAQNSTHNANTNITVSANASDSDGSISQVQFLANGSLIGTRTTTPYSITWSSVPAGTYVLTAIATDNLGATTTSTARTITVNQPNNVTLPSCVITYPHSNAYYQQGSDIVFRVFSRADGGSFSSGTISNIEFFVDGVKVHETSTHTSHTYQYIWPNVPTGNYRLTARATNTMGATFTSAGVLVYVGTDAADQRGMSACKGKYLANIIANSIRSDFGTYWNGVTAENGSKWGSIEGTRNVMNWTASDLSYNYANNNNLPFRYHAIAWGSQYPNWITSLPPAQFQAEIDQYMALVAARYPHMDQIDVLNENLYLNTYNGEEHAAGTPYFRAGMGGPGVTGYDWAIWLFERARFHFPNSKLVMNDFELEGNTAGINEMLDVIKVLRDRGLIDGFGTQAHCFNIDRFANNPGRITTDLNHMAQSGLPVYPTEIDMHGGTTRNETTQLNSYQNIFPRYWEHPAVAGVTLWGWIDGQTWQDGTGIMYSDGTKRPAMIWLENYIASQPNVGYPFCGDSPTVPVSNILINGEFDNSTTGWDMQYNNSTSGTFTIVTNQNMSGTNAARVCPTNAGTANWHVQLRQNAPFVAGKTYEISFMAKADAARTMDAGLQMEGDPWTSHWGAQQNLTTANQTFNYTFTPTVSDASAKLKFYVGTNTSCVYIDNVIFREQTAPVAPPATITPAGPTTFCAGESVVLNANAGTGYTYQWRLNNTNITGATSASYTATQAGSYTVRVTANSLTTTSEATTVTVDAIPATPTITNNNPVVCEGTSITLSIPFVADSNIAWEGPNGFTASTRTITRDNTTTTMGGTYTVTRTVNGCTSLPASTSVVVNTIPSTPSPIANTPLCEGETLSLSIPTVSGATYSWSGPNGYTASENHPSRTNTTTAMSGTYSVSTLVNGCSSTLGTVLVSINPIPAPPAVISPIVYKQDDNASALSAAGSNLLWYTDQTTGSGSSIAPTPNTQIIGEENHYVSQTIAGCESSRSHIEVFIEENTITQTIELEEGWNLISLSVLCAEVACNVSTVFEQVNVEIVKNSDGFWKSSQSEQLNSLHTIEPGKGYLVYMNTAGTIEITGIPCSGKLLFAPTGWQLIGYPCCKDAWPCVSTPISDYFNATNAEIIKNFDGFWQPNGSVNSITEFIPGKGYFFKGL